MIFGNFNFTISGFAPNVENIATSLSKSIHSSMEGIELNTKSPQRVVFSNWLKSGFGRLFSDRNHRRGQYSLGGLGNVHGKYVVYLLLFKLFRFRPCSVWPWIYRFVLPQSELDAVLHRFDRNKEAILHAPKLFLVGIKVFKARRIVVQYSHFLSPACIQILDQNLYSVLFITLLVSNIWLLIVNSLNSLFVSVSVTLRLNLHIWLQR